MKKWEYKIIDSRLLPGGGTFKGKDRDLVDMYFAKLGREGWEVVTLDFKELQKGFEFTGLAKRELQED